MKPRFGWIKLLVGFFLVIMFCTVSISSAQEQMTNPGPLSEHLEDIRQIVIADKITSVSSLYEQTAQLVEINEAPETYFSLHTDICQVLLDQSRYEAAYKYIIIAKKDFENLPLNKQSAKVAAIFELKEGISLYRNKRHEEALVKLKAAELIFISQTNHDARLHLSEAYDYQGKCYNYLRKYNKGLEVLDNALVLQTELLGASHSLTMNTMRNIGDAYHSTGYHQSAIDILNRALSLSLGQNDDAAAARTYHDLSKIYEHKRDFIKAREFGIKALELNKCLFGEKHGQVAKMLHQIGNALFAEKKYEESLDWYQRSIDMRLELYGHHIYNSSLTTMNLGKVHGEMGNYDKSIEKFMECWSLFDEILPPKHARYSELWLSMGYVYQYMGNRDEAHRYFQMAYDRAYSTAAEKSYDRATCCLSLASTIKDPDEALMMCQKGIWEQTTDWEFESIYDLPQINSIPNEYWVLQLLDLKGDLWVKKYQDSEDLEFLNEALKSYRLASDLIDYSRGAFFNEGAKKAIANEGREIYEKAVQISYLIDSIDIHADQLASAFYFIEQSRSLVLLEAVNDQYFGLQYMSDSTKAIRQTLKTEIQKIDLKLEDLNINEEVLAQLNAEIFELKNELSAIDEQIEADFPTLRNIRTGTQKVKISDVKNRLTESQLFINYLVTSDHIYAMKISQDETSLIKFSSAVLPEVLELVEISKSLSNAEGKGNDPVMHKRITNLSYSIYKELLAPLKIDEYESLVIVPDGILSFLPFEILTKEMVNEVNYSQLDYVIKSHNVGYAFSANLFTRNIEKYNFEENEILAFAPEYNSSSNKILASRSGFTSLKHIKHEAANIVDQIGGTLLSAYNASEENFKRLAPKYRFLHLAMHAFTDEQSPMQSGLIFTNNPNDTEDNVLHTFELYNMSLPAEMVVLSACNTGSGKLEKGEGVMSLARGFRQAGVPNIVMSLWQADDQSTRIIMQKFYELLKRGLRKDEALRRAKLDYLANNFKSFPYFWGAFVLTGDVEPLQFTSWWEHPMTFLGGLLLFLGGYLYIARRKRKILARPQ